MLSVVAPLPESSYAPELYALKDYFERKGQVSLTLTRSPHAMQTKGEFDLCYLKMGFSPIWRSTSLAQVHDYSSASIGRFSSIKDFMKRRLSTRPVLRSFLSPFVESTLGFNDGIPHVIRDMGVPESFLLEGLRRESTFEYDLLYVGSITASRRTGELFRAAERAKLTMLAVGEARDSIDQAFLSSPYITFTGPRAYFDLPGLARLCRFGINYTPDIAPYRFQTSTKVLEYLALGLPVVTNDYAWVRNFEDLTGARLLRLKRIDQLSPRIVDFEYAIPDMAHFSWDSVLDRSGIHAALLKAV